MVKQIINAKFISGIHSRLMNKIQSPYMLKEGEQLLTLWKFPGNKYPHAGQIQGTKILPNGNKQVRIATAYAGDASLLATDTRVYSPKGELLKAYHGIRGSELKFLTPEGDVLKHYAPTREYANTSKEIAEIIRGEEKLNPIFKHIPDFPKS